MTDQTATHERARTFTIEGHPTYRKAQGVSRVILYTASECMGCFDRTEMHRVLAALDIGESATWPALRFVDGPSDPPDIIVTRTA
jgi:hypothetical protein